MLKLLNSIFGLFIILSSQGAFADATECRAGFCVGDTVCSKSISNGDNCGVISAIGNKKALVKNTSPTGVEENLFNINDLVLRTSGKPSGLSLLGWKVYVTQTDDGVLQSIGDKSYIGYRFYYSKIPAQYNPDQDGVAIMYFQSTSPDAGSDLREALAVAKERKEPIYLHYIKNHPYPNWKPTQMAVVMTVHGHTYWADSPKAPRLSPSCDYNCLADKLGLPQL